MLELEVVTPKRRLFSVVCDSVTLPGKIGEFQVLSGHAPLLTGLRTGILSFYKSDTASDSGFSSDFSGEGINSAFSLMVSGGFAEIADNKVTVLSESAAMPGEVKAESEKEMIAKLEVRIKEIKDEESKEFKSMEVELERSAVKLSLLKH